MQRSLAREVRAGVAAAALALAGVVAARYAAEAADRAATARLVVETGLWRRDGEVARGVLREPDPTRARVALARALVAEALDPGAFRSLPTRDAVEAVAGIGERLELAEGLAAAAWREQPANWQAAMLVGAARYWGWARRGDARLVAARDEWERPLQAARRLAPGSPEPLRFLALAYLEVWPALTSGEQAEATGLLGDAFADPLTLRLGAPRWLAVAPDRAAGLAKIPREPWAWQIIERGMAAARDWAGACDARRRYRDALDAELRARLEEARARLTGGDAEGARDVALRVVGDAPADLRYREAVVAALRLAPPGAPPAAHAPAMARWLDWALDGAVRGRPRLDADVVARLLAGAGDLPPARRALAELAAGDLARAEVIERRAEALGLEAWAPYSVLKARVLAARAEAAAAREALATVHRSWRGGVVELGARLAVAEAAGDLRRAGEARDALDALAATRWPSTAWRWDGAEASLDLVLAAPAAGLELALDLVPPRGAAVAVAVDGVEVLLAPVAAGGKLHVATRLAAGAHRVALVPLAGGRVAPGELRALAPGPA